MITTWQVAAALVACSALATVGFALGRLTADDSDRVVVGSSSGPADDSLGTIGRASTVPSAAATVDELASALTPLDLEGFTFAAGTADLTPDGMDAVRALAEILLDHPSIPIAVTVQTTTEASAQENRVLSTRQAEAVVAALIAEGVDMERLAAVGLGPGPSPAATGSEVLRLASDDPALDASLDDLDTSGVVLDEAGQLVDGASPALDELAARLAASPDARLELFGHAYLDDPAASHDRSHALADRAVEYLVAAGIDGGRLDVFGMGDALVPVEPSVDVALDLGPDAAGVPVDAAAGS